MITPILQYYSQHSESKAMFRYQQKALSKLSYWERTHRKAHYPCPGCILDPDTRKERTHKFEHWHQRSSQAWRLYWRTHPDLYQQMSKLWRTK